MNHKRELFDKLINKMSRCKKCTNMCSNKKDYSLINIFENTNFAKQIPSIWTDWYNRLNADIMILGQDWGPYVDMEKLNKLYLANPTKEYWNILIEKEKSLTKKQLTKYLIDSSNGKINSIENIYITNAIMCARKGNKYRADNINLKAASINCKEFLELQINIVKPKIIATLGFYPLYALSKIYNFEIEKSLSKTIEKYPIIQVENFTIIPLYHPVAQIKYENQLKQYKKIWEAL